VARSSVVVVGDLATLVCSWWMNLRPEGGCGGTSVPPGGKGRNRRGLATPRREPRRQIPFGAPTAIGRRGSRRPTVGGSSPAPPTSVARSSVVVVGDLATLVCSWWMNLRPEGGCV